MSVGNMKAVNIATSVVKSSTPEQMLHHYTNWAPTYDSMLDPETYVGPVIGAEEVTRLIPESLRAQAHILDVGAGTGKVGIELKKTGFAKMDALEPCVEMMDILKDTKLYQNTFTEFIGNGKSTLPKSTYDVTVVVGSLYEGHIPCTGLDEMIDATKKGGYIVNVMRQGTPEVEKFMLKLRPHADQLEAQGRWKKVKWEKRPKFIGDKPALVFVYQVL